MNINKVEKFIKKNYYYENDVILKYRGGCFNFTSNTFVNIYKKNCFQMTDLREHRIQLSQKMSNLQ